LNPFTEKIFSGKTNTGSKVDDISKKLWVQQSVAKMTNKDLAENIILFLQHCDIPEDNSEVEIAGYKLYLWAETELKDG